MCQECRQNPCAPACPNYEPLIAYKCNACGSNIYEGDLMFVVDDKHYCEDCCYQTEAEVPEPDEDLIYESWRDRQLEREDIV